MLPFINSVFDFLINRPLIMLLLMGFPLLIFGRVWKIFPTRLLLLLATVPALLSVTIVFLPAVGWFVLVVDGLLVLLALIDWLTIPAAARFTAARKIVRTASLTKPQDVEVELTSQSPIGCHVTIKDDLPQCFTATPPEIDVRIDGKSRTLFKYHYVSHQRGLRNLRCIHLKVDSLLKLWNAYYQIPCESAINVYPDMKQISEYDLLAKTNRLSLMGLRRTRKIGQDNEFERLRDYTPDDNFKHIDWRTTARRQKLTVRDFQSNQSQRIIFMVDCGRMMTGQAQDISMLDHALNAMLMLSYVALKQGDSVGLISFSNTIHNYTPARPGVKHINRLLHASYNQQAQYVESRYDEAFVYLKTNCHKRSLVVLITNVIDEINAHQVRQYMSSLTGRHLPLGVLLRDREIFRCVDEVEPEHPDTIYRAAAAVDVLSWRQQVITDLHHQGILMLDVFPEQLTSNLVNQYLEIKARHLL